MNENRSKINARYWLAIFLPWLVLPAYGIALLRAWSRLGPRLAVHFGAAGAPNGWQNKGDFALTSLGTVFLVEAVFSLATRSSRQIDPLKSRQLFAVYYGSAVFVALISWGIVQHSLHGGSFSMSLPIWAAVGAGALGYWLGGDGNAGPVLNERRADGAKHGIIGIDVHRKVFPIVIRAVCFIAITWLALKPRMGLPERLLISAVAALTGYSTLLAAAGYSYIVRNDSVEVRGLFRPARVIPREDVNSVDIRPASRLRGHGWRLWPGGAAYYLGGKQAVQLKMPEGSLFLGSNRPAYLFTLIQKMLENRQSPRVS
jgi:hypothetical protein